MSINMHMCTVVHVLGIYWSMSVIVVELLGQLAVGK